MSPVILPYSRQDVIMSWMSSGSAWKSKARGDDLRGDDLRGDDLRRDDGDMTMRLGMRGDDLRGDDGDMTMRLGLRATGVCGTTRYFRAGIVGMMTSCTDKKKFLPRRARSQIRTSATPGRKRDMLAIDARTALQRIVSAA